MNYTKQMVRSFYFIVLLFAIIGCAAKPSPYKASVGQKAPYTNLTLMDGNQIPLSSYLGKNVVLMLWATWCHNSRPQLEEYNALAAKYAGRPDMVFLAVSLDKNEKLSEVQDRITYKKLGALQHCFSGNAEYDEANINFGSGELPQFVVIDKTGQVIGEGDSVEVIKLALALN